MRNVRTLLLLSAVVASLASAGCYPDFLIPVPMPAWVPERMEEKLCRNNDFRSAIMPPILPGSPPPLCEDPPTVREVLRAMPHVRRGVPFVFEEFRDDVNVVSERIKDT